jgi:NADH dehydrogenase (ubiquinone) 1 alpha subcomplex subunit 9
MGDLGQIVQMEYSIRDRDTVKYAVERSNVVVNMVGREWETRNFSFEDVHVTFPAMLAEVCKEVGVERLVHVSALGASASNPSTYYQTKAAGDDAVRAAFPSATIVQPSKLIGGGAGTPGAQILQIVSSPFICKRGGF